MTTRFRPVFGLFSGLFAQPQALCRQAEWKLPKRQTFVTDVE
jgi:hypothetical protein